MADRLAEDGYRDVGYIYVSIDVSASDASVRPQGGTCSIHEREVERIFFGLKIYTLGIFWGQEICHIFF